MCRDHNSDAHLMSYRVRDTPTLTSLVMDAHEVWLVASYMQTAIWPRSLRQFLMIVVGFDLILMIII